MYIGASPPPRGGGGPPTSAHVGGDAYQYQKRDPGGEKDQGGGYHARLFDSKESGTVQAEFDSFTHSTSWTAGGRGLFACPTWKIWGNAWRGTEAKCS